MQERAHTIASLEDHRRLTADVMRDLRVVREASEHFNFREVTDRAEQVLHRVEHDVFRIAVVGEFKRGKSTLINALLGKEILPADVLPCSATLNRVTYGLTPSVRLRFVPDEEGNSRETTISIDELSEYVTKLTPDSEQRASDIQEAVVHYPVKYCRDKADIIDTPGLNDDESMTRVTLSILPEVDAALLVILAQSPFSGYEADFLNRLLTHDLGRVMFVVNRLDEIRRPKDRERVIQLVRDRIKKAVQLRAADLHGEGTPEYEAFVARLGEPKVFGVSGGLALDAKLEDDQDLLAESKLPEFEHALERFLTLERGLVTLTMVTEATGRCARKTQQQAEIRRGALHMEADKFDEAYKETSAKLTKLRARLSSELAELEVSASELRRALRPMARALPGRLTEAANLAIDGVQLDTDSIKRKNAKETSDKLRKAVVERVQTVARTEAERTQLAIEKAAAAEVQRLEDIGARISQELAEIELQFTASLPSANLDDSVGVHIGVGAVAGAVGGGIWGGAVGGAIAGYRAAGVKGAATGAAAGVVSSFATTMAGLVLAASIGLPLSWPVVLPTLAVAGIASTFGAKWATNLMFGQDRVDRFREDFRKSVISQLDDSAGQRVAEVLDSADRQVDEIFGSLRAQVEQDLGGTIEQTQRTLDELRTQTARSDAQRERELTAIEAISSEMAAIDARMHELHDALVQVREEVGA